MKKIPFALLALALVPAGAFAQTPPADPAAAAAAPGVPGGPPPVPTAPPAVKVPVLSPEEQGYYMQEQALVRQLRLLALQAQIAEQQRKIMGDNATGAGPDATGAGFPALPPSIISRSPQAAAPAQQPQPAPVIPAAEAPMPFRLLSTWGTEGQMAADVYSGGLRVTVRGGDALPGGWVVHRVARTGIIVRKGRAKRTLTVGG